MATAVLTANQLEIDDRLGWGFALLLGTTATLLLRPADLVPMLENWPIYQGLIFTSVLVSGRTVLRQLSNAELARRPVNACLLVLMLAIGLSHLSHGFIWGARMSMYEVSKLLALYVLIVGLVNTPQRLLFFVKWLTITITTLAALALLDRLDVISIAALESVQDRAAGQDGQNIMVQRIRGTGIFHDPNDFGLILVAGLTLCTSFLFRPHAGWPRYVWLIPGGILLVTLALTHSRGALIALVCAVIAALCYRRGGKFGVLALLGLPLLALGFSGRMTNINAVNEGTGQTRLQIWSDSLTVWRRHPVFGLGEGLLSDETGMTAHNSFIHCYAELGIFGGTAFLACFLAAGLGLWRLRHARPGRGAADPATRDKLEHWSLTGFIFAALVGYAGGMLSISRQFVAPTYLILGLAAAAQSLPNVDTVRWRIDNRFLTLALFTSAMSLLAFYLAVRLLVRW